MNKKVFLECPYCKNKTLHRVLANHIYNDHVYFTYNGKKTEVTTCDYFVVCEGCNKPALYYTNDFLTDDFDSFEKVIMCHPNRDELNEFVPDEIKKIYSESGRILELSPSAYVTQIRKALEFICKREGAKNSTLKGKIKELVNKNILPGIISKIADKIRLIGNIGAHEIETDIKIPDAWILRDLFRAIVEYLYVIPNKIKRIEESVSCKKFGQAYTQDSIISPTDK